MHIHNSSESQAGPSYSGTSKYHVQTSDVLQDMRVNVSEEGTDKVIWYKERFLDDNEIVENVVHNATNTICWTIHRPLRGWYIRIRSPMFPPGVFIPLTPVSQKAPYHVDAAMSFNSRTNVPIPLSPPQASAYFDQSPTPGSSSSGQQPGQSFTLQDEDITSSSSSLHSYPPTPTGATINIQPPSPLPKSSVHQTTSLPKMKIPNRRPQSQVMPSSQITQFVLAPSSIPPTQQQQSPANTSFFSRALNVLKSHRPSHSNSFTLSRLIPPSADSRTSTSSISSSSSNATVAGPPPPYASNASLPTSDSVQSTTAILGSPPENHQNQLPQHGQMEQQQQQLLHTPLLVFHDQTPVLTVRSLTGLIELDKGEERALGVDTSFWIAVALTYLEFLEERESYLAALSD